MFSYIIRRVALFIPSLILLSIIIFGLSRAVPGSAVTDILYEDYENNSTLSSEKVALEEFKVSARANHYDLAPFYFAVMPKNLPDDIHSILLPERRQWYKNLSLSGCHWETIEQYETEFIRYANSEELGTSEKKSLNSMRYRVDLVTVKANINQKHDDEVLPRLLNTLISQSSAAGAGRPKLRWYGPQSQYHHWIGEFLSGKMSVSLIDGRRVSKRIFQSLGWTSFLGAVVFFLSILLSILLSIALVQAKDKIWTKVVNRFLLVLYSIPSFWLATLAIVFLTNDHYSPLLNWFSPVGIFGECLSASFWCALWASSQLILPILIMTLLSLPFLVQQLVSSLNQEENKLYFKRGLASGLSRFQVLRKEALLNALIPFVTICVARIPAIFSGSLIMEIIFNIPGLGKLMFDSVFARDWPIVFTVCLLLSVISMLALLLGDLVYARLNPKLKLA